MNKRVNYNRKDAETQRRYSNFFAPLRLCGLKTISEKSFFIPIFLILSFLLSCNSSHISEVLISGEIKNPTDTKIVFSEIPPGHIIPVDSANLNDKNEFSFKLKVREPGFYMISGSGKKIILSVKPGEKITLNALVQNGNFKYHVTGSPDSELLEEFFAKSGRNAARSDSLVNELRSYANTAEFYKMSLHYDTLFDKIAADQRAVQVDFINKNPHSLASLIVLNYTFGGQSLLKIEQDPEIFLKLDSLLGKDYPGNEQVEFHHKRIMAWKTTQKPGK